MKYYAKYGLKNLQRFGKKNFEMFYALTADGDVVQFWVIKQLQVSLHSMINPLHVWNGVVSKNKLWR